MFAIWISPLILLTILSSASAQPATQIKFYQAYSSKNVLNSNLVVTQRFQGNCTLKSVADSGRTDTWRCQSNNITLDPCFQDHNSLACVTDPWSNRTTIIESTQALPSKLTPLQYNPTALPWGLELANGQRCTYLFGTSTVINQMRINYACTDYNYNVIGDIDRSTSIWQANVYDNKRGTIEKVAIHTVWF